MPRELNFVLIGQSNMVGWTESKFRELPNWMKTKPRNVHFFQHGRQMDFSGQPGGRIGPEVAFAKFIAAYYPGRPINIIKLAVGGTSIYDWAKNWNPRVSFRMADSRISASLYALLKRQIQLSRVLNGKNKTISAFLWMQGERDARFPQAANAYLSNMTAFIRDLRYDYQSPHARFILGRINPPIEHRPAVHIIRHAQEQLMHKVHGTRYITTDDLAKADDRVHYNTRGQVQLGRRFADEFRRIYR
ncbi:MAG: hypothetical protein KAG28_07185 [Cocleimonas sp.]|nr:hypothetical protein [Cocleimonas sp.]